MEPYDAGFIDRLVNHEPRAYLVGVAATAHAQQADGTHIVEISWVRMGGDWFAAWQCRPSSRVGEGKFIRAPHLDAANMMHLGQTVGQVVTPDCFNYGENGVLDPAEPVEQGKPTRRTKREQMHQRLVEAITSGDIEQATRIVDEMDRLGLWGTHPRGDDTPRDGHVYECCGKTGRISPHKSWCEVNKR